MSKFIKAIVPLISCFMLTCTSVANASDDDFHCKHKTKTCNDSKNHPSKYVGVYIRTDVPGGDAIRNYSIPFITLNEDGTASVYFGEALIDYVTAGTISPDYGNWKELKHKQVVITTLGVSAQQDVTAVPPINTFGPQRSTLLIDFSNSLNTPQIVARALVDLTGVPSSEWLNPSAGTLLFNNAINPRPLKRVCAFTSDLTRTN